MIKANERLGLAGSNAAAGNESFTYQSEGIVVLDYFQGMDHKRRAKAWIHYLEGRGSARSSTRARDGWRPSKQKRTAVHPDHDAGTACARYA